MTPSRYLVAGVFFAVATLLFPSNTAYPALRLFVLVLAIGCLSGCPIAALWKVR